MSAAVDPSIKAGQYELVALMWEEPVSKPGEPYQSVVHRQGDIVTLSQEEAQRLYLSGAVLRKGERQRAQVEAAKAAYLATLAGLPEDVRAELNVDSQLAPKAEPSVPPVDDSSDGPVPAEVPAFPAGPDRPAGGPVGRKAPVRP